MRKLIIFLMILSLFYSCASINRFRGSAQAKRARDASQRNPNYITQTKPKYEIIVLKHPDLRFPSTEPDSVVIYEGFKPLNDKYYVVGKMGIIEDTMENYYRKKKEINEKAAEIGGQAVIIVDADTITKEYGGDMVGGISVPQYFWWDSYPLYLGTDYYWYKSPKMTISTSYRIGLIIRWAGDEKEIKQRINYTESEMDRLKENYPLAYNQEAWGFLGQQYGDQKGMNVKPGEKLQPVLIALLEDKEIKLDIEKAMMLSHHKNLDEVLAKFKKLYPLASKLSVWNLLMKKDNEGNPIYSSKEAIEFSHQLNYYKEEIAKLKKIYPRASGEKVWIIVSEKDENADFKYSKEERTRISYIWKFIENRIAEFRKRYPLIPEKKIWELLLEKDEEGNYIYSVTTFPYIKNLEKKEK